MKKTSNSPNKVIIPGPGFYDIKDNKTIPQFTFGEKIKKIKIKNTGVDTYHLMKENDWRVPCYSFWKELKKNLLLNEEILKYSKGKSQLRLDIDNIN